MLYVPLAGEASVLAGAPQGSLLPLFPPEGAGAPPEPQGSPPGLTPAEGGEEEPPANTRGEPLEGGTPTPPIPPQGSGIVELEIMGPMPPQGSWPPPPVAPPAPPTGLQGSRLAAVLCGGLGLTTEAAGPPKLRSTRSLRALPPLFFGLACNYINILMNKLLN